MNDANPRTDDEPTSPSGTNADSPDDSSEQSGPETDAAQPSEHQSEEPFQETLEERYEELEERYEQVRDSLEEYNRTAMDFIRENPGICIVGALGTGYLVGRLASRRWLK